MKSNRRYELFMNAINIAVIVLMVVLCFNRSVWKDETCDLEMITHPYSYFLLRFRDSAPPFHFFVLKLLVGGVTSIFPAADYIIVAKLVSVVPYIIIFILSNTLIRKIWGGICGATFSTLMVCMPNLFTLGMEIRQYTWSMLITLLWFLSFYYLITKKNVISVVIASVMGPMALLTHYYVVFGIAYVYLLYFIMCIREKRSRELRNISIVMIMSVILFSAWIIGSYKYILNDAKTEFNILVNGELIRNVVLYVTHPDSYKWEIIDILAIAGYVLIGILLFIYIRKRRKNDIMVYAGLGMVPAVMICGLLIGRFVIPCFQARYMIPVFACFWLSVSILISKSELSGIMAALYLCFFIGYAFIDIYKGTKDELEYRNNIIIFEEFLKNNEGELVIDDSRIGMSLPYYTDRNWYDYDGSNSEILDIIYKRIVNGKNVYFIESRAKKEEVNLMEDMRNYDVEFIPIEHSGIEYIFFDIYQVERISK